MSSTIARRVLQNLVLMMGASVFTLLAVEVVVRWFWDDAPRHLSARQDDIFSLLSPMNVQEHCNPDKVWYSFFTRFRLNCNQCRGPELPREAPGRFRIAMIGDSFVFGIAVEENETIPGVVQTLLRRASGSQIDVINAGAPGNQLTEHLERFRKVIHDYQLNVVILMFTSDDLNFVGQAGGRMIPMPVSENSPRRIGESMWGGVASAMLPDSILGDPDFSHRFRYWLASVWKTYLYVAFELRRFGDIFQDTGRELSHVDLPATQIEKLYWEPSTEILRMFRDECAAYGVRPVFLIFSDIRMGPILSERLVAMAEGLGIETVDLSSIWGDDEHYLREYTLGWDPHPNADGNRLAAENVAAWLAVEGLVPGTPTDGQRRQHHAFVSGAAEYARARAAEAKEALEAFKRTMSRFSSSIEPGIVRPIQEDQLLQGWWFPGTFQWDGGEGRWMADNAGFWAKVPDTGATKVQVSGYRPLTSATPESIELEVTCPVGSPGQIAHLPRGSFSATVPIGVRLSPGEVVECRLATRSVGTVRQYGLSAWDERSISLAVTRLSLE